MFLLSHFFMWSNLLTHAEQSLKHQISPTLLVLFLLAGCAGEGGFRLARNATPDRSGIHIVDARCDAGSFWNGRGWPSSEECQRKVGEGEFSGSCERNEQTGCYGIPSSSPSVPPSQPRPQPIPQPHPPSSAHCDAGSIWNGRGWSNETECLKKASEGTFTGGCGFNAYTGCYGIPAGLPPLPTMPPMPHPTAQPAPPTAVNCDAGGFWNGRGWPSPAECQKKLAEDSFCGACAFNTQTGCYGVPAEHMEIERKELPPGPYPTSGMEIAEFVERHFHEYTAPTNNLCERKLNMMFLRNRMIEVGICAGLDLGLNLKRGGPEVSIDFLTHNDRESGLTLGIDIGFDFDNYSRPLDVTWNTLGLGTYKAYTPRPVCK